MNDTGGAVPGSIHSLIPDPEVVLALEPEELAGFLMGSLNSLPASEQRGLNRFNFGLEHTVREYPEDAQDELTLALMEAWVWLEREGLLVPKPGSPSEGAVIISSPGAADGYRRVSRCTITVMRTCFRVASFIRESRRRCGRCSSGATTIRRCFRHSKRSKCGSGRPRNVQTRTSESL